MTKKIESKSIELWVACEVYGKHRGKPNNPDNQYPVGTFKKGNLIAKKPAYYSKKAIYGAARYSGFDKPSYEDNSMIVYEDEGYYSKQDEYYIFVKSIVGIDVSNIKALKKIGVK